MRFISVSLLLFFSCLTLIQSQVQSRFPVRNTSAWRINYEYALSSEHVPGDQVYKYFTNGDTLIGGKTYYRLYKTGILYLENPLRIENKYMGALRDSANKYFFVEDKTAGEVLLYDFDRQEGQAMDDGHFGGLVIDLIDTLNDGRRRFHFDIITAHCGSANTVVEGIGWLGGLLEGNSCYAHPGIRGYYAVCYSDQQGGYFLSEQAINNGYSSCDDVPSFIHYPGKPKARCRIEDGVLLFDNISDENISEVRIFDLRGIVMKKLHPAGSYPLKADIHDLVSGCYLVQLLGSGNIYSFKFILSGN